MSRTATELRKDAAQARHKIERKGFLIHRANKRIAKWDAKVKRLAKGTAKHDRAVRKRQLWKRRKHDAIYLRTHWQAVLADALKRLAARKPARLKLLQTAEKYLGEREGGAFHRKAAEFVGAAIGWPWCSTAVAEWLHEALGYSRDEVPDNAPYSGCWAAWPGGKRVAISKRRDGDINVYDWGDGGMTDHVALSKRSTGERCGGNQDDAVNLRPENPEFLVFVVRPRERKHA